MSKTQQAAGFIVAAWFLAAGATADGQTAAPATTGRALTATTRPSSAPSILTVPEPASKPAPEVARPDVPPAGSVILLTIDGASHVGRLMELDGKTVALSSPADTQPASGPLRVATTEVQEIRFAQEPVNPLDRPGQMVVRTRGGSLLAVSEADGG